MRFCDFTVIRAASAFTPSSSRYLSYPSNFIGRGHPNKPANGERMIRQGVDGLAIGSGAFQSLARDRDAKPDSAVVDRALDNGTLFTTGREPRSGRARQKSKRRRQMFQGHFDLDAATPVQASAIPDVLFERGLYWASGRSGVVNLVAAHKWFNLAARRRHPAAPRGRRADVRGRDRHGPARSPGLDDDAVEPAAGRRRDSLRRWPLLLPSTDDVSAVVRRNKYTRG